MRCTLCDHAADRLVLSDMRRQVVFSFTCDYDASGVSSVQDLICQRFFSLADATARQVFNLMDFSIGTTQYLRARVAMPVQFAQYYPFRLPGRFRMSYLHRSHVRSLVSFSKRNLKATSVFDGTAACGSGILQGCSSCLRDTSPPAGSLTLLSRGVNGSVRPGAP